LQALGLVRPFDKNHLRQPAFGRGASITKKHLARPKFWSIYSIKIMAIMIGISHKKKPLERGAFIESIF
jgi:hypothetical protein